MRTRIPVLLLALSLTACEPRQPQEVPPPPASPDNAPPANPAPDVTPPAPADPTSTPSAPAQPPPAAPPPTEPSAAPKPTAIASIPALNAMALARPGAKMSVAVDLRYQFDGAPVDGQATTLHLAAVSRVDGSHLTVQVKPAPGIDIANGTLSAQKVAAAGVYRQQLSVTRHSSAPDNLRVLVTMDMPEGTAFGYFTIPFGAGPLQDGNTAQKSDSVKQR